MNDPVEVYKITGIDGKLSAGQASRIFRETGLFVELKEDYGLIRVPENKKELIERLRKSYKIERVS